MQTGAGVFWFDTLAGRMRMDTWSVPAGVNSTVIFACNPDVATHSLPNLTCATYEIDWVQSTCVRNQHSKPHTTLQLLSVLLTSRAFDS
jgi:hypothetical protein